MKITNEIKKRIEQEPAELQQVLTMLFEQLDKKNIKSIFETVQKNSDEILTIFADKLAKILFY